jgi:hypothetical protein
MDTVDRGDKLPSHGVRRFSHISWSAIIAGALIAFSLSALFNMFNAGIGLITFPQLLRGLAEVGVGGYIWLLVCSIVAMFLAGLATGYIGRYLDGACYGFLQGFIAWSLALLVTFIITIHLADIGAQVLSRVNPDNRVDVSRVISQHNIAGAAQSGGSATLGVFFIFLVGAISAAVGGSIGAKGNIGARKG